jgi:hypothetical protein
MSCTKCKKKEMREQVEKEILKMEKWVTVAIIIVIGTSLYGLFSFIKNFL